MHLSHGKIPGKQPENAKMKIPVKLFSGDVNYKK